MEVEDKKPPVRNSVGQKGPRIVLPMLRHPHGVRPVVGQSRPHGADGAAAVEAFGDYASLVEGVEGEIGRAQDVAEEAVDRAVVLRGHLGEPLPVGHYRRTDEGAPLARWRYIGRTPCGYGGAVGTAEEVGRYHARIARHNGRHAEFGGTGEYVTCHRQMRLIPAVGERTAASGEIVHIEPCEVCRSGQKRADGIISVRASEQVGPDALEAFGNQRRVDAAQGHPVEFLLPAVPVPECHGVGMGAEIEIVSNWDRRGDGLAAHYGQFTSQRGLHVAPSESEAHMAAQEVIDAGSDGRHGRTFDRDGAAVAADGERLGTVGLDEPAVETRGGVAVSEYSIEQTGHGLRSLRGSRGARRA